MKAVFFLSATLMLGTVLPDFVHARDCKTVLAEHRSKDNGTLFYNSDSGFRPIFEGEDIVELKGNKVFLLRKGIDEDSVGGVLVVKIGRQKDRGNSASSSPRTSSVTLRSRFTDTNITRCEQNAQLRQKLESINGTKVSYKQFQDYVKRPAASRLDAAVKKQLDKLHFAYKDSIKAGESCNKRTNQGSNLIQHSLVPSDTGPTTYINELASAFWNLNFINRGNTSFALDWTVRMIPYDMPRGDRSETVCIEIRAPELSGARLLRINDLEERKPGVKRGDWRYNNRHHGDRKFWMEDR